MSINRVGKQTISVNGVPIRLTDERWEHIIDGHADLANYRDDVLDVVQHPDEVRFGYGGALIALRGYGKQRYLAVIYKEISVDDGFIITARFAHKKPGGKILWRKH
ncbi:hypothetical protein FJZ31_32600 [Candidatus Poribacteria bacterium]|nr:hypothetical protein [Candidatus Poribacteria bacterium]